MVVFVEVSGVPHPFEGYSGLARSVAWVVARSSVVLGLFSAPVLDTQGMVGFPLHTRKSRRGRSLGQSILKAGHRNQVEKSTGDP